MQVVIIGAGVIGAAIAEAMARRGADVTLLDMRGPGRGASQASAGILAPYTEAHHESPLLRLGTRSLDMFDGFVAGVRERSGRPVDYARTGTLEVAFDRAGAERLRGVADWLDVEGVEHEWVEGDALFEREPALSRGAAGGLFVGRHGFVAVPALVDALVHSARLAGAMLQSPVEAVSVAPGDGGRPAVRAGDRQWVADAVVVAAGSWSGRVRVQGAAPLPVRPVRGQLLHLEWRGGARPARVIWGPGCYTVPWSDGSLLVGATVEDVGFDESSTVGGVQALAAAAARLLPAATAAAVGGIRVGLRPALADGLPAIGEIAPAVVAATAHYRNGILLAPLTAELVARLVLDGDRDADLAPVDPRRTRRDAGAPFMA